MHNYFPRLSLIALLCFGLSADFRPSANIGKPRMGGNGCPTDSANTTMQDGGNKLSISFKGFQANTRRSRMSCNIAIPIEVPRGQQFAIATLRYSGFNSLSRGSQATFRAEHFFAGQRGPRFSRTFRGRLRGGFNLNDPSATSSRNWSPCGRDVNLRVNASLNLVGDGTSELGGRNNPGLSYRLKWRRCR